MTKIVYLEWRPTWKDVRIHEAPLNGKTANATDDLTVPTSDPARYLELARLIEQQRAKP